MNISVMVANKSEVDILMMQYWVNLQKLIILDLLKIDQNGLISEMETSSDELNQVAKDVSSTHESKTEIETKN